MPPIPGTPLPQALASWLDRHAEALDTSPDLAAQVVPQLADAGLFRIGVPAEQGGSGGSVGDAIDAIAAVAERSLTAAFVFWGHRTFIEYLLRSPNGAARERWLGALLRGELAGATGLSNAMKYLSGIEALQIGATAAPNGWRLDGALAWVTNLRKEGFVAAAAVTAPDGAPPAVVAFSSDSAGVTRSADLNLLALRGSNTAAVQLADVRIDAAGVIAPDARAWLPAVRPAFLGMQCAMSIGLAHASLAAARQRAPDVRGLAGRVTALQDALASHAHALREGVDDGRFVKDAAPLFRLRIGLAELVQDAALLELQASGGRAYLLDHDPHFARRWREAAFVPIVTPSLTQLRIELEKRAAAGGA
jgi:alkylation response protein AidB-like acyl-CoA dehydrogenase